jgi:hypothetical protein
VAKESKVTALEALIKECEITSEDRAYLGKENSHGKL